MCSMMAIVWTLTIQMNVIRPYKNELNGQPTAEIRRGKVRFLTANLQILNAWPNPAASRWFCYL
jgi:hypothetical protein